MKTQVGPRKEDSERDLYWVRINFLSDDGLKNTKVLAAASREYLNDLYKVSGVDNLFEEHFNKWVGSVVSKWLKLDTQIFNQDVHYDVYSNTEKGEANGIDFLISKAN